MVAVAAAVAAVVAAVVAVAVAAVVAVAAAAPPERPRRRHPPKPEIVVESCRPKIVGRGHQDLPHPRWCCGRPHGLHYEGRDASYVGRRR